MKPPNSKNALAVIPGALKTRTLKFDLPGSVLCIAPE
jgi:hypothetical protein